MALRGAQSREAVCALLWPEAPPEAARNSLSAALSSLRRELGDETVRADRQAVALSPGAFETDVAQFEAALRDKEFAREAVVSRALFCRRALKSRFWPKRANSKNARRF